LSHDRAQPVIKEATMFDDANPETGADAGVSDESAGFDDLAASLDADTGESNGPQGDDEAQSAQAGEPDFDADEQDGATVQEAEKAPEARTFKVKVADGEIEVDEAELVRGYQRLSDYSRNIQQVKQVQKELLSVASEANTVGHRAALAALMQADDLLALEGSQELANLRTADPGEYAAYLADIQARRGWWQQQIAAVDETAAKARNAIVARESEALRSVVPDLADPSKATAFLQDVLQVGSRFGLSESDMDQVTDHRIVLMAKALADAERKLAAREAVATSVQQKRVAAPSMPAGSARTAQRVDPRNIKQAARISGGRDDAAIKSALRKAFD
jgi:hypothetical protein